MNIKDIKEKIKSVLRFLNIIIIKPKDSEVIVDLKKFFIHNERSFVYLGIKYLTDCLFFEASPGVAEIILLELVKFRKERNASNSNLLNMGGGSGQATLLYEKLGFNVYSLDLRSSLDDKKNIYFDLNSDSPIPFEKNTFDVVVCQEVIEHIENPWKIFRNAKELLKEDGIFIVSTPNILSLQSKIFFLFNGKFKWFLNRDLAYHINPIPEWEIRLIADKIDYEVYLTKGNGDYFLNKNNKNYSKIIRNNEILIFFMRNKQKH
jgi:2-polyprenyl-3-methyl-5-hydroxy-6-metoxy-1,4-benzoquinol methylase